MLKKESLGKGGGSGDVHGYGVLSSQVTVTCAEALLSRKQLNIYLPVGSSGKIPYFALLVHAALLH